MAVAETPTTFLVTVDEVIDGLYAAGFRGEALAVMAAIAYPESGLDAFNMGDVGRAGEATDDGRTWGPSFGLFQVRTIVEASGSGDARDIDALSMSLLAQCQAAWEISGGGTDFGAWSTYNDDLHRDHLAATRTAGAAREAQGGTGMIGEDRLATATGGQPGLPGGGGGGGSPAPVLTPDVLPPAVELIANYVAPRGFDELVIAGVDDAVLDVAAACTTGSVDLTADKIAELKLTLADPFLTIRRSGVLTLRAGVAWRALAMEIAALETVASGGAGYPTLEVTARQLGAQRLKRTNVTATGTPIAVPPPPPTSIFGIDLPDNPIFSSGGGDSAAYGAVTNLSATEYADQQATSVGLLFAGKGTARRDTIAPVKGDDGVFESPYQVLVRLANEEGHWLFVTDTTLFFAPPSWLVEHAPLTIRVLVTDAFGNTLTDLHALNHPDTRESIDSVATPVELTLFLPRWRGEQVRPGMAANVTYDDGGPITPTYTGPLLVDRVTWAVDDGISPVEVHVVQPVDPPVQAATPPAGGGTGGGTTPAGPTGPYGYQYDEVGDVCLAGPAPGAEALMAHMLGRFPGSHSMGIHNCRDICGNPGPPPFPCPMSIHAEGRALDVGSSGDLGQQIADYAVANAAALGIQAVIWNRQDWNSQRRTWDAYNGRSPHTDHVHIDLCWDAAGGLTAAYLATLAAA